MGIYLTGLRNAHALENEAMAIMERQIERLENYPDVKKRLQQHLKETEAQASAGGGAGGSGGGNGGGGN